MLNLFIYMICAFLGTGLKFAYKGGDEDFMCLTFRSVLSSGQLWGRLFCHVNSDLSPWGLLKD